MYPLILLVILLTSCASPKIDTVNISYVKTPLNVPAIINMNKQFAITEFQQQQDVTVKYHTLRTGAQQLAALASKEIDIVPTMGSTSLLIGLANDIPLRVLGIFGRSPKAFTLMTKNPSILSMTDFKNKRIGGPKGSVLHQMLLVLLEENNMTSNDIEFISMDIQQVIPALMKGEIDGGLLVGPSVFQLQKEGVRILYTGEGRVDGATYMVTHQDFIDKYPDLVYVFLHAHEQSVNLFEFNQEEALDILENELSIPRSDLQIMLQDYDFERSIMEEDLRNIEKTQEFLLKYNLIPKKIDFEEALYEDHVV